MYLSTSTVLDPNPDSLLVIINKYYRMSTLSVKMCDTEHLNLTLFTYRCYIYTLLHIIHIVALLLFQTISLS